LNVIVMAPDAGERITTGDARQQKI